MYLTSMLEVEYIQIHLHDDDYEVVYVCFIFFFQKWRVK